jgi:hypothetical protein
MSEEVKKNEEIYNDDPIYEEPSKSIKIGDLDITLCNELIQEINENLNITFVCESEIDVIQEAFKTNKNPIVYGDDSYTGYTAIDEFGYKVDSEDKTIYRITLSKPEGEEPEGGLTQEQSFAIACAIPLMTNDQILQCVSVLTEWKEFIGGKMKANQRFQFNKEAWESRQEIPVVLEGQEPGISTAALYQRIKTSHAGTQEDPIPYSQLMTVYKDKYYIQNDVLYLCLEDSGQPLYADCESLPRYFQKVE